MLDEVKRVVNGTDTSSTNLAIQGNSLHLIKLTELMMMVLDPQYQ